MGISVFEYNSTLENLLVGNWKTESYIVGAQLLNSNYVHSPLHSTRADILAAVVGLPVVVKNKTIKRVTTLTTLDCDDIDFTVQGTFTAAWVIFHEMQSTSASSADKLLFAVRLNDATTVNASVNQAIRLSSNGFIRFARSDYVEPVVADPTPITPPTTTPTTPTTPTDPAPTDPTPTDPPPVVVEPVKACTVGKTVYAPQNWVSGDVICCDEFSIANGLTFTGLNFDPPVILRTTNNTKLIRTGLSGRSLTLRNCNGITVEGGWDCYGGLYGVRIENCSRIKLIDVKAHDVGQEAIQVYPDEAGNYDDLQFIRPVCYNTGLSSPDYGEGIYVGVGFSPSNPAREELKDFCSITNVYIENPHIYNTTAEAIDIKPQCLSWTIKGGLLENIDVPFNSAITYTVEDYDIPAGIGEIDGVTIKNVTCRMPDRQYGLISLGHGDVTIKNCQLYFNDLADNDFGILLFSTYVNPNSKTVTIEPSNRFFNTTDSSKWLKFTNQSDPATVVIPASGVPFLWLDASNTETLTVSGSSVTQWRDLSGNGFNFSQSDSAKRPNSGLMSINNRNVIVFDGVDDTMSATLGPQMYDNSMFFAVVDANSTTALQSILSMNVGTTKVFGAGFNAGNGTFTHSEASSNVGATMTTGLCLIAGYKNGNTLYIRGDGQTATNANGGDIEQIYSFNIGSRVAAEFFSGAIGEIQVFNYYDAAQFASIESALMIKWGISAANYGQGKTFNVIDTTPLVWFDAADTATIAANSNVVSTWNDKSGNARNLSQPTTSARLQSGLDTVNSLNAITVPPGARFMSTSANVSAKYCIAAFYHVGDADNEYAILGGNSDNSIVLETRWRASSQALSLDGSGGTATGLAAFNGGALPTNPQTNYSAVFSADQLQLLTCDYTTAFQLRNYCGRSNLGNLGKILICEILWWDYSLTSGQRANVLAYLSDKWGGSI